MPDQPIVISRHQKLFDYLSVELKAELGKFLQLYADPVDPWDDFTLGPEARIYNIKKHLMGMLRGKQPLESIQWAVVKQLLNFVADKRDPAHAEFWRDTEKDLCPILNMVIAGKPEEHFEGNWGVTEDDRELLLLLSRIIIFNAIVRHFENTLKPSHEAELLARLAMINEKLGERMDFAAVAKSLDASLLQLQTSVPSRAMVLFQAGASAIKSGAALYLFSNSAAYILLTLGKTEMNGGWLSLLAECVYFADTHTCEQLPANKNNCLPTRGVIRKWYGSVKKTPS